MHGLSVLVVDDELDTRDTIDALLHAEFPGCSVVQAEDGQQAIAALDHTRFDLVVVDYRIPFFDGIEVARYASKTKAVRCVLVTGYADPAIGSAAIKDGILLGMLHKTASSVEFIEFLRTAVHGINAPRRNRVPQSEAP